MKNYDEYVSVRSYYTKQSVACLPSYISHFCPHSHPPRYADEYGYGQHARYVLAQPPVVHALGGVDGLPQADGEDHGAVSLHGDGDRHVDGRLDGGVIEDRGIQKVDGE